jgi:hypothetical protein
MNGNNLFPLWLPKGSVRALIALGVVASTILIAITQQSVPEVLGTLAGVVVTFYFKDRERAQEKKPESGE